MIDFKLINMLQLLRVTFVPSLSYSRVKSKSKVKIDFDLLSLNPTPRCTTTNLH